VIEDTVTVEEDGASLHHTVTAAPRAAER